MYTHVRVCSTAKNQSVYEQADRHGFASGEERLERAQNYSRNPQWHMYNRPEHPSHAALMAARDRLLTRHPDLRFVGAHLASLEYDVDVLAERLRRHPNLAVDIS